MDRCRARKAFIGEGWDSIFLKVSVLCGEGLSLGVGVPVLCSEGLSLWMDSTVHHPDQVMLTQGPLRQRHGAQAGGLHTYTNQLGYVLIPQVPFP